jgi:hypothetical protein
LDTTAAGDSVAHNRSQEGEALYGWAASLKDSRLRSSRQPRPRSGRSGERPYGFACSSKNDHTASPNASENTTS